jgi:hypothetical protein
MNSLRRHRINRDFRIESIPRDGCFALARGNRDLEAYGYTMKMPQMKGGKLCLIEYKGQTQWIWKTP